MDFKKIGILVVLLGGLVLSSNVGNADAAIAVEGNWKSKQHDPIKASGSSSAAFSHSFTRSWGFAGGVSSTYKVTYSDTRGYSASDSVQAYNWKVVNRQTLAGGSTSKTWEDNMRVTNGTTATFKGSMRLYRQ